MAITGLTFLGSANSGGTTVGSVTILPNQTVPVGSTVVVVARCGGGLTFPTNGCTDTAGNTYTRNSSSANATGTNVAIFSAPMTAGLITLNGIVVSLGGVNQSSHFDAAAYLINGSVNWKNHFDQQASNQTTSAGTSLSVPLSGTTASLWRPGDIVIGVIGVGALVTSPNASGYTFVNSVDWMHVLYKTVTTTTGVNATFGWTTSSPNSAGAIAAFRPVDTTAFFQGFEG